MAAHSPYERLVDLIYAAVFDERAWPALVAAADRSLGVDGSHLLFADVARPDPHAVFSRLYIDGQPAPDVEQRYLNDFLPIDERVPRTSGLPVGQPVHNSQIFTASEMRWKSAVYNELLVPLGATNQLCVRLPGEHLDIWTVGRRSAKEFDADDADLTRRLARHLAHMARMRRALADADALSLTLAEVLERASGGVVLLDGTGRMLACNAYVRDLFNGNSALTNRDGELRARGSSASDRALRNAVRDALPSASPPKASVAHVAQASGGARLLVHVCPICGTWGARWHRGACVFVAVHDSRVNPRADPEIVGRILGLTASEADVAVRLASGFTVREIAELRHRSVESVRFHLKQVYGKTGTHRQAELIRLVLAVAAHGD